MTIEQVRHEIAADPDGFINARLDESATALLEDLRIEETDEELGAAMELTRPDRFEME